jgi:hypothetical protein
MLDMNWLPFLTTEASRDPVPGHDGAMASHSRSVLHGPGARSQSPQGVAGRVVQTLVAEMMEEEVAEEVNERSEHLLGSRKSPGRADGT